MKARIVRDRDWQVLALCTDRGDCELLGFLSRLDASMRRDRDSMLNLLDQVARHGPPNNEEMSHKLSGDIWEFTRRRLRVLYFRGEGQVVVCTHGLIKRQRKIPRADIEKAQERCNAFRAAKFKKTLLISRDGDA